jgi:hypothetical protein
MTLARLGRLNHGEAYVAGLIDVRILFATRSPRTALGVTAWIVRGGIDV